MTTGQNVLGAVRTERVVSRQGFLQKLFAVWFDAFVYNQIWEDPKVDIEALKIDANSRILTISSGGCNALNYLAERPQSITAVDLNRYHIYLTQLKITALKYLPGHEDFFNFFGLGKHRENVENYQTYIAPNLDEEARAFWGGKASFKSLFIGPPIQYFDKRGLYDNARNGYFLRFFHRFAHLVGLYPEEVLKARTLSEQEQFYIDNIGPFFDSFFIRAIGKLPVTAFGLGIPPQQLDELKDGLGKNQSIIDVYRDRVKKLACSFPIDDNYFAWQAFARKYDDVDRRALPEYLKVEHFQALKAEAYKVRAQVGSVTGEIQQNPRDTFNRFVLLDAQDWMNARLMTELWQAIADKAEPGARIIFRTAAAGSPLKKNLPKELLAKFSYEKELSIDLFERDRVSIYGGFHLYTFE